MFLRTNVFVCIKSHINSLDQFVWMGNLQLLILYWPTNQTKRNENFTCHDTTWNLVPLGLIFLHFSGIYGVWNDFGLPWPCCCCCAMMIISLHRGSDSITKKQYLVVVAVPLCHFLISVMVNTVNKWMERFCLWRTEGWACSIQPPPSPRPQCVNRTNEWIVIWSVQTCQEEDSRFAYFSRW